MALPPANSQYPIPKTVAVVRENQRAVINLTDLRSFLGKGWSVVSDKKEVPDGQVQGQQEEVEAEVQVDLIEGLAAVSEAASVVVEPALVLERSEEDLRSVKREELEASIRQCGLTVPAGGTKADLVEILKDALRG